MKNQYNFYREIHKAIRSMLSELVVEAGRVDFSRTDEVEELRVSVRRVFALLSVHADLETRFIAPLFARCDESVGNLIDSAHAVQEDEIHEMLAALDRVDAASADAPGEGHAFVLRLARFAGEALVHMSDEEEIAMPALRRAYDELTLVDVDRQLGASVPPEASAEAIRWMLTAVNAKERVGLLHKIRRSAPTHVFEGVMRLAGEVLSREETAMLWREIDEGQPAVA